MSSPFMRKFSSGGAYDLGAMFRPTPAVKTLLIACLAVFFFQVTLGDAVRVRFALWPEAFRYGHIYQLFTYMFLHGSLIHLLFNMLILVMFGSETERSMGTRHFTIMYLVSGMLGGLGWVLITQGQTPSVGASGAIFGIIAAFAVLHTHERITVLIFFVLPVTMKAWVLAAGMGLIEFFFVARGVEDSIAHGIHLAGGVAGCFYALAVYKPQVLKRWTRWLPGRKPRLKVLRPEPEETVSPAEIDQLLDKIARKGMSSLSKSEKEKLGRASKAKSGRG